MYFSKELEHRIKSELLKQEYLDFFNFIDAFFGPKDEKYDIISIVQSNYFQAVARPDFTEKQILQNITNPIEFLDEDEKNRFIQLVKEPIHDYLEDNFFFNDYYDKFKLLYITNKDGCFKQEWRNNLIKAIWKDSNDLIYELNGSSKALDLFDHLALETMCEAPVILDNEIMSTKKYFLKLFEAQDSFFGKIAYLIDIYIDKKIKEIYR